MRSKASNGFQTGYRGFPGEKKGIPVGRLGEWDSGRKAIPTKKKQGTDRRLGLFLASSFYGFDDRIQKGQFLACRAVQRFDSLGYGGRVDIGYPPGQFFLTFCGFGRIHDQIDGRHASDNGHLPGRLPAKRAVM